MPEVSLGGLFAVALVAAGAPLVLGLAPRLRLPAVVLEIVAGIVLGPSVLGWVEVDLPLEVVGLLGLAFLLFLAGLEVDVARLRGPVLRLAGAGYAATLALGLAIGALAAAAGWVRSPLLLAVALSATSLGLVVPVLLDSGRSAGQVGQVVLVAASLADVAAVLLLSVLFSMTAGVGATLLLVAGLLAAAAALAVSLSRAARSPSLGRLLVRLQDGSAEVRVRLAVALLLGVVVLAQVLGLEVILGAFLAGAVVALLDRDTATHPHFRLKLEALGYGFLIPVFFVTSGLRFDLGGLLAEPAALARVPAFLAALLVVRALPALLYRRLLAPREVLAAGLLQATTLPFLVTAVQIGVLVGALGPVTGTALVAAGLLSVVLFPPLALRLLSSGPGPVAVPSQPSAPRGPVAHPREVP